ncbi:hypothetical protein GCM10007100_20110 [Roseibacillus persicicus]|uniref:Uncharacterized protein n=1 Tax=Roseibacillus persicicus TaxID=454148 RepID=A0A918TPA7_9BACT|nr:hypothetical protein GCM10007100_20110 [Roseibacillus persicicus]
MLPARCAIRLPIIGITATTGIPISITDPPIAGTMSRTLPTIIARTTTGNALPSVTSDPLSGNRDKNAPLIGASLRQG